MSNEQIQLKQAFTIAQKPSEEQKRQHEIRMVQDKERRSNLETMVRYRDQQIKREERRLEDQREHTYRRELAKKVKTKEEMHLVMKGVTPPSVQAQANAVKRSVENKYGPAHAAQIDKLRSDLNGQIDRQTTMARGQAEKPSRSKESTKARDNQKHRQEKTPEARKIPSGERQSQFRANARSITQPSSKGDGKGGGKSGSSGRGR